MKVVVAAFNQEKALVGAFSVITNLRIELFEALFCIEHIKHYSFAARWGVLEAHQTKSMVAQTLMTDNGNV